MKSAHAAVSRDTRVLLTIVVIAVATLWALARLRFPDRITTPNPVPPVLAQLAPPSAFDDITAVVAQLQSRLQPALVTLQVARPRTAGGGTTAVPALIISDNLAAAFIAGPDGTRVPPTIANAVDVVRDRASHLTIVRLPDAPDPVLAMWIPRRPSASRFLIAADPASGGVALRPVFVGPLHELNTPLWSDPIWALGDHTDVGVGTFMFTADGAFAGLVVQAEGRRALVPAQTVFSAAERLAREGERPPGWIGVEVQPLTPAVAAATGASAGAVVTWLDPHGPGAAALRAGDVVEQIDGRPVGSLEDWTARVARLTEGESITMRVRRAAEALDVPLTAVRPAEAPRPPLGLVLRTIPQVGAEIVRVEPASAAAAAGLQPGDVLTAIGDVQTPTASQARRAFASVPDAQAILVAATRGVTHRVLAIERTW